MAKLRVGIIGVGVMGRTHTEAYKDIEEAEPVAVVDTAGLPEAGPVFAAKYGLECEPTLEALLSRKDIDAIVVCTPHSLHAEHTIMALEAGKHVLLEKPMEVSLEKCDAIIEAARRTGLKLMVAHSHRYWPGDVVAKELIAQGAIGRVVMVRDTLISPGYRTPGPRWTQDPKLYGSGGLISWGCHCMDRFRYWLESEPTQVYARSFAFRTEIPGDTTTHMIMIDFANGVSTNLWYCEALPQPGWPREDAYARAEIVGEKGLIDCNPYVRVKVVREGAKEWETVYNIPKWGMDYPEYRAASQKCFADENRDFIRSILDDTEPPITGFDGRKAVEMCVAAYRSGETGQVVKLPL